MKCLSVKPTIRVRPVCCKLQSEKELNERGDTPCTARPKQTYKLDSIPFGSTRMYCRKSHTKIPMEKWKNENSQKQFQK